MSKQKKELGQTGEELAAQYLLKKGYQIIARNVRYRTGELDIVAQDGDELVFVEVRTRRSTTYGTPGESITWRKQKKVRELALTYIQQEKRQTRSFRFDVVLVVVDHVYATEASIEHIVHAF